VLRALASGVGAPTPALAWRPLEDLAAQARLAEVLASWDGTPYMLGQRCKGVGVDCIRFVVAVIDELAGTTTRVRVLPGDVAHHAPAVAFDALARVLELVPSAPVLEGPLEPGDVVVTGPLKGGPGHALIVGVDGLSGWHATQPQGVCRTGLGVLDWMGHRIVSTHRLTDRRWARA
jgi:hypothetical protein